MPQFQCYECGRMVEADEVERRNIRKSGGPTHAWVATPLGGFAAVGHNPGHSERVNLCPDCADERDSRMEEMFKKRVARDRIVFWTAIAAIVLVAAMLLAVAGAFIVLWITGTRLGAASGATKQVCAAKHSSIKTTRGEPSVHFRSDVERRDARCEC